MVFKLIVTGVCAAVSITWCCAQILGLPKSTVQATALSSQMWYRGREHYACASYDSVINLDTVVLIFLNFIIPCARNHSGGFLPDLLLSMASSTHEPKSVSWSSTTVTFVDPPTCQNAAETRSSTVPSTHETRKGVDGDSSKGQAAQTEADIKDTVQELIGSSRIGEKAIDPSKPRRNVSV